MKLLFSTKDILEAGVDEIIGDQNLKQKLDSGQKLRVKLGIDPTSPNIHLGRSLVLWRLRAFQELGHEIHLIVGDFTGQIGDTSDKNAERPMLSEETITANLSHYLEQIWMILNPEKKEQVHIHHNSEWLAPLTFAQIGTLADAFSVNQFIKRDLISRRLDEGSRVSLREMLYPLMQGYDSVVLKSDVEIGGTDQRFNMLAGRVLQEQVGQEPQSVIMNTLIDGTDGRKMSSSWGNVISLRDTPQDIFGKIMTINDSLMEDYLLVLPISTRPFSPSELKERIQNKENPRDLKLELAERVVELYHGEEMAKTCKNGFITQFSEGNKPKDIPTIQLKDIFGSPETSLLDILVETKLASSKTDARRLIEQGGIRVDDAVITDTQTILKIGSKSLIQAGKRRFLFVEL